MKKQLLFFIILFFSFGLLTYGQTVNLNPTQDNSLYADTVNNSNGQGNLYAGNTCAIASRRALMKFDFSSIPAGATITDVTLTMNTNNVSIGASGAHNYTLHRITTDWGEGASLAPGAGGLGTVAIVPDATWNDAISGSVAWATPGGDFDAAPSQTHPFPATVGNTTIPTSAGLVADVQNWIDSVNPNYGWIFIGDEVGACKARRFGSKETGVAPILSVTYTTLTTVNLNPNRDNSMYQNSVNNSNGQGPLFSGNTCASSPRRALMEFDLSSIPAGATITSVTLTMNTNNVSIGAIGSHNYTLHKINTDWGEGASISGFGLGAAGIAPDATWNNAMFGGPAWTASGGDFTSTPSSIASFPSTTGGTTFPNSPGLVIDVQNWIDGNPNYGWVLIGDETTTCTARRFGSKDTGTAPILTIIYDTALSVNDFSQDNTSFVVYPNPSSNGIFNINNTQNSAIEIVHVFDILGKRIKTLEITESSNNISVNLSDLKNGVYFLMVRDATGNTSTEKIIRN